jgi:hypothetical protein
MMPQLLTVRIERPHGRTIRIWLPVLPVALLLSPLLVLAALATAVACRIYRVRMMSAFCAGGRLVCALPGTRLNLHEGRTGVHVGIR